MTHVPQIPVNKTDGDPLLFDATLSPHRSLSTRAFIALMIAISSVSFAAGLYFTYRGAWPVMGFLGLDALLIYVAFRLNYRSARLTERIVITTDKLVLARRTPSGSSESWTFNSYWTRVELVNIDRTALDLRLTSHGRYLSFGRFLADEEKQAFAAKLRDALDASRH